MIRFFSMKRNLLDAFDFKLFNYEVVFEFVDCGLFRRIFSRKEQYIRYYIRQVVKMRLTEETVNGKECVFYECTSYEGNKMYYFAERKSLTSSARILYWDTPTEPEAFLTRVHLILCPSKANVVFSTENLNF